MHLIGLIALGAMTLSPAQPPQSLFDQLGLKYTGLNGMEDYLVAADLANRPDNRHLTDFFSILPSKMSAPQAFLNWVNQNGYPAGLDGQSTYLDACAMIATRFEPIQKAVQEGNRKQLSSLHRGPLNMSATFPELGAYRQVSRMVPYAIHYDLARGDSNLAVTKVEDMVTFGERLSQDTLIEALVGLAIQAIPVYAIEFKLNLFSVGDLKRLRSLSKARTSGPLSIDKCIENEITFSQSILADAKSLKDLLPGDDISQWPEEFQQQVARYSLEDLRSAYKEAQDAFLAEIRVAMNRPESERENALRTAELGAKPAVPPQTLKEFAHMLVRYLGPQFTQINSAAMRRRTQLRLLGLHTYVLEYKWNWDRLPEKLEECAPKELLYDPYAGKTFVYQKISPQKYELYSEGTQVSGRINLSRPTPSVTTEGDGSP